MKGYQGFVAYLLNQLSERLKIESTLVVKELLDMFPKELTKLPSDQEVEFSSNLILGT